MLVLAWISLSDNYRTQSHLSFGPINKKISLLATKFYGVETS